MSPARSLGEGEPTVSVIVPAYNAAPFLDAALASLAAQSRPADEVVVVNDASTDDTARVAKRWATLLPLVLVERPVNRGLGAARELGIENASGELIALLDADDYLMPDHLAVMVATWRRHGGVVAADDYRWLPGRRLNSAPWASRVIPPPEEQRRRILAANFGAYCSLFSRADYEAAGGFRPLRKSEDWDLWIRMVRNGVRLTPAPTVTLMYRKRPDSLSGNDGCAPADMAILEGLLDEVGEDERPIVRKALRRYRARQEFAAAFDDVAAGRVGQARRRWLRAALLDRGVRSMGLGTQGSVALRSLPCLLAPRRALAVRAARQADARLVTA